MRTGFLRYLWIVTAFAFCLLPGALRAQVSTTGEISGTVVDPSGAVVPHAKVTASEPSTGFTQTVTASASGVYVFPAVQPGMYTLRAIANGFATAVYSNVVVSAAQTTNVQIQLKVGAANETVTVSAQGQILKTTQPDLSTTISPTLVENLPLNGRDLLGFCDFGGGRGESGQSALHEL